MAEFSVIQSDTRIVLDLSETEAIYVWSALGLVEPAEAQFQGDSGDLGNDPVFEAVGDALDVAGVPMHSRFRAARVI